MKHTHTTGLGDPSPEGKMALFQPPQANLFPTEATKFESDLAEQGTAHLHTQRRIRTTIDLTNEALVILQQIQQDHRLKTGHVMPIWKALSMVITSYSKRKS